MPDDVYSRLDKLLTKAVTVATGPTVDAVALRRKATEAWEQTKDVSATGQAVATEVAMSTPFTATAVAEQFQTALAASSGTNPEEKIADATESVAQLTSPVKMSLAIDLSNPHMMNDWVRGIAAIVCGVLLAGTGAGIVFARDLSGFAYSALGVLAVLLVAASLVFVMGYGNAKINLSPPGADGGDESSKAAGS